MSDFLSQNETIIMNEKYEQAEKRISNLLSEIRIENHLKDELEKSNKQMERIKMRPRNRSKKPKINLNEKPTSSEQTNVYFLPINICISREKPIYNTI